MTSPRRQVRLLAATVLIVNAMIAVTAVVGLGAFVACILVYVAVALIVDASGTS